MPFISGQTSAGKSRLVWEIIKRSKEEVIFFPLSFSRVTDHPVFCPAPLANLAKGMYAGNLTENFVSSHLNNILGLINVKYVLDRRYINLDSFFDLVRRFPESDDLIKFKSVLGSYHVNDQDYLTYDNVVRRCLEKKLTTLSFCSILAKTLSAYFNDINVNYRVMVNNDALLVSSINGYMIKLSTINPEMTTLVPSSNSYFFIFDSLDNIINVSSKYSALGTGGEQLAPLELALLYHNNMCLSAGHKCLVTFNLTPSTLPRTFKLMQYFVYLGSCDTESAVGRYILVVNPYSRSQAYFQKYIAVDASAEASSSVFAAIFEDYVKFEQFFYKPENYDLQVVFKTGMVSTNKVIDMIEREALINLPTTTVDIIKRSATLANDRLSTLEASTPKVPSIQDINDDISTSLLKQTLESLQRKQDQLNKIAQNADRTNSLAIAAKNREISSQIRDLEYKLHPAGKVL